MVSRASDEAHPTLDGRGITIGVLDTGVDLDHPALQQTTTRQREIIDWATAVDPLLEGDLTWRPMLTTGTGPTIPFGGVTYRTPAGSFAINSFAETITADSEIAGDVNRDGDTTDVWGVLYDPATHDIWEDVDQDRDFTDEVRMRLRSTVGCAQRWTCCGSTPEHRTGPPVAGAPHSPLSGTLASVGMGG